MTEVYVELHARSAFSFLEGSSLPEELIFVCSNLGGSAMALLDRDGVYGAPRFHMAAKKSDIKAHIGSEITLTLGNGHATRITHHGSRITHHSSLTLPLLVQNRAGYQNLCRLITLMKLRAPKHAKPGEVAASLDELAEHAEGLICLTGGDDGPLAYALGSGGLDEAITTTEKLAGIFGRGNVYAELQRHFNREEESRNQAVVEVARRLRLPLLATNGVCYASAARRQLADVLTCVRNHVQLEAAGRLLAGNSERFLKPASAMSKLFADLPEAIAHTWELSSRLGFTLQDLGYEFPKYPVPDGESMDSFLRKRTYEGARWRYNGRNGMPPYQRALQQIDRELALIEKLHLAGYFLIVWDIINFCRDQNILVQGRGSAANSAVCYSLGITAVDPVGMELLFERFLSEERGEWPDIDLDLPSGDQRERVIQYVYQRYGTHGAAMTANVITYRGRSAAREVGKAMGFDEETITRLSSLVRAFEWQDPNDTPERQFRDAGLDLRNLHIKKFCELYVAVQDLPRHLGQHSGGMVICQGQLDSVVPLEPAAMPGRVVVQWDKEDCADMGIIKVDLLGLGMMAAIEECLTLITDHYGETVDLAHLPQDDPAVYDALCKADTIGLFQVESRAQMSCLPRLRPQKFYDIVVQVAIIRPGPIVGNMVHPYLNRRLGREEATCLHPSLEPVLKRTLGVPLFQEQLLRIAMICSNFTGGEAEELRRAMGFKRSEARMQEIEIKLRRGMEQNGITGETQDKIVQAITSFALYGFPESHAASFALIAYASAYLKCHYLAAFTAAILNNQPMGFYQPATLIKDAQRHGLKVNPIDITRSDWLCTVEGGVGDWEPRGRGWGVRVGESSESSVNEYQMAYSAQPLTSSSGPTPPHLRLGLLYVRGFREESAQAIVRERATRPFADIDDLHNRVPELRKDELRKLAEVGALNFIKDGRRTTVAGQFVIDGRRTMDDGQRSTDDGQFVVDGRRTTVDSQRSTVEGQFLHRRSALWQVERAARAVGPLLKEQKDQNSDSPLSPMTIEERVNADFRGTGLTIGRHPMAYRREELNKLGIKRAIDLREIRNGVWVRVAGWIIVRQRPGTAKGFLFLSMEDETGIANVIVTPDIFDRNRVVLVNQPLLLIEGPLQNQDNVIHVRARRIEPLSYAMAAAASHDFH
ncbi:MAG TPA: error-prone DNA polymerase [Blastocatellia bacterium]|nr:error-prone DNA polymerase [Blastocatellia bacterium]